MSEQGGITARLRGCPVADPAPSDGLAQTLQRLLIDIADLPDPGSWSPWWARSATPPSPWR